MNTLIIVKRVKDFNNIHNEHLNHMDSPLLVIVFKFSLIIELLFLIQAWPAFIYQSVC